MTLAAAEAQPGTERVLGMILVSERERAEDLLARIRAGDNFQVLATRYSTDATAAEGGYLGPVKLADVRPELRQALEGVAQGQVTPVFQIPAGFMILKVLRKARPESGPEYRFERIQFAAYVSGLKRAFTFSPPPETCGICTGFESHL